MSALLGYLGAWLIGFVAGALTVYLAPLGDPETGAGREPALSGAEDSPICDDCREPCGLLATCPKCLQARMDAVSVGGYRRGKEAALAKEPA